MALFFCLDVLHPSTPSANSTQGTDTSHPTQGWYPSLGISPFFCALQGASPSWGTPFSHTPTTPRGYSLHKVPHSCDSPLNMCRTSLNQDFLHIGIPEMHSDPSLAQGKHVSFIHYLHHHLPIVTNLCPWDFSHIFVTLYSPGALALLRAPISLAYNQSIGGQFIKRTSNF